LHAGLTALGITPEPVLLEALFAYVTMLAKWNRVYNLTAVRDTHAMLVQHLFDSLSVLGPLQQSWAERAPARARSTQLAGENGVCAAPQGPLLADIGSGAGLPGIPLALAWPALHCTLVEPVAKKAAFLRQAAGELGLTARLDVAERRIQQLQAPMRFDFMICRAYASLAQFVDDVGHLVDPDTQLLAMKGVYPTLEIEAVPPPWRCTEVRALRVPSLAAQRHLVYLQPGP
jgi:16S rRNA (guanine527-N7)-methyltransferase